MCAPTATAETINQLLADSAQASERPIVSGLRDQGYGYLEQFIEPDESVFSEPVVAETDVSQTFAVYTSAVGAPIPDDLSKALDPEIWRPMWEEMEEIIRAGSTC